MKLSQIITRVADLFYITPVRALVPIQTFRYGFCGGMNMILDTVLYYVIFHFVLCEHNMNLGFIVLSAHIAALFIVFPITFFNGFWLNKHIAFRYSPLRSSTQLFRYVISVAGSIVINYICMKIFVDGLEFFPTPSKVLSTLVTTAYSYLMQKYFTFKGSV